MPTYVVDAHHHLWNLETVDYPWLRQRGKKRFFGDPSAIQKNYGVSEFRLDHGAFDVRKSVHVEVGATAGAETEETRWIEAQAVEHAYPSAIVASCNLSSPQAPAVIEAHLELSQRVRGIRQIFSIHPDEDAANRSLQLLADPVLAENLKLLSSHGLSFDLQLTPRYMIRAAQLFGRIDGLKVALCHAGSPWRRDPKGFVEWRQGLQVLAESPTMSCKLSGLGMFDPDWTAASLKPYVMTVLEIFGPDRVMWGSNFPVDKLYRSYHELLSALLSIVPKSMHDRVFRRTAERFYRL